MNVWGLTRLDRYLLRELSSSCLLGVASFSLVFLLNEFFLLARETIEKKVPITVVLSLLLGELPRLIPLTLPMGLLVAVLVTVGRMATHHEILALRANGVSPTKIFKPVLIVALAVTVFSGGLSIYLDPIGYQYRRVLGLELLRSRDLSREINPGVFFTGLPGTVLYAEGAGTSRAGQGRIFEGIFLHSEKPDGSVQMTLAERGRPVFDPDTGRISLLLDRGKTLQWQPSDPEEETIVTFTENTSTLPSGPVFRALTGGQRQVLHRSAVGLDLWRYVAAIRSEAELTDDDSLAMRLRRDLRKARLELHRRFSIPVTALLFAMAGFPLAARSNRGGRFAGLTQALLIIFAFFLLFSAGMGFSEQGSWPPWLGPWLPQGVLLVWALWLWRGMLRGPVASLDRRGAILGRIKRIFSGLRGRGAGESRRSEKAQRTRPLVFTRLDAYLAAGHFKMTIACLSVLLLLMAAFSFKEAVDEIPADASFPWGDIFAFIGYSLPGRLDYLLPFSVLAGVMISLSGLNRAGEIIALRASGVGPMRIGLPLIGLTLVMSASYMVTQETVLPATERESREAHDRLSGRKRASEGETGRRWLFGDSGHLWSYAGWDSRSDRIVNPWLVVLDVKNARVVERIDAREAQMENGRWTFLDGRRHSYFAGAADPYRPFERWESPFADSAELFEDARSESIFGEGLADQMTFRGLLRHTQRMERVGIDLSPLLVGLHRKLAEPLLPVLLVAFGIPLVLSSDPRKGSLYGFGIALIIVLFYYAGSAAMVSLGREGVVSPAVAVWLPPGLLGMGALFLTMRER